MPDRPASRKPRLPATSLLLAAIACHVGVSAEPVRSARVTVIPPYSPPGQPVSSTPPARPPAPGAPVLNPPLPMPLPVGPPIKDGLLKWDAETQNATVTLGTLQVDFTFQVTNLSQETITVTGVTTTCGCTVAKLPANPWRIAPGTKETLAVAMNLAGKRGPNTKSLTVNTDHGHQILNVHVDIQDPPAGTMSQADRVKNLQIASANRQAVLHGACAACHSTPAINKTGADLYQAACAICHEAAHRAASVPDLKHLLKPTDSNYWRTWITTSVPGKLMPAFAIEHGGILNTTQIDSLVKYLVETNPSANPAPPVR